MALKRQAYRSAQGWRASVTEIEPGRWCAHVLDPRAPQGETGDATVMVWFESSAEGAREVLDLAAARLGCVFEPVVDCRRGR